MRRFLPMKRKIMIWVLLIFVICIVFLFVKRRWIMIDEKQGKLLNTPSILFIYYQGWSADDMDYVEIIDSYGMRYEISGDCLKGVKLDDIYDLYKNGQLDVIKKSNEFISLANLKENYEIFLDNLKWGKIEQEHISQDVVPECQFQVAAWFGVYKGMLGMKHVNMMSIGRKRPLDGAVEDLCYWIHEKPSNLKERYRPLFR